MEAMGRLRHLIIMESNITADGGQPTIREIDRVASRVKHGDSWQEIFPGVASLRLDTQGHGLTVSMRLTRHPEASPVRVVREHEHGFEEAAIVREINILDRYSMTVTQLARNLGVTMPRTLALVRYLRLQEDEDCYKEIRISSAQSGVIKRYSPKALQKLQVTLRDVNMDVIWTQFGSRARSART